MNRLITEYKRLKSQLINPGCEETIDEVMWNDTILISIEKLLKDISKDTIKQLNLNHL